ncbi:MAG: DNA polymerase III subunit gamma/tau [Saccharofermentanales bacterium]
MGHIALYREWRPRTFEEVVEQHFTVAALKQAVISGNIGHAYLFSGTRGTGKTTMAQIFSRAINCLSPENGNPCNKCSVCTGILNGTLLDVIEMDAASNNNVDTIRRICDEIIFAPSVARFKVYIIDEVHMLSAGAFNALLKTLEEPPAHAVFILATTEQHRIPATILSRCQRYEFRRIPVQSIVERLGLIAGSDGISIDGEALQLVARLADGALRDAISLLDQAKGSFTGVISKDDILSLVGMVNDDFMYEVALSIVGRSPAQILSHIEKLVVEGRDVMRFTIDLVSFYRNVMVCLVASDPAALLNLSDRSVAGLQDIASRVSLDYIIAVIRELSSLSSELKWSLNPRITLEVALIRLMESIQPAAAPAASAVTPGKAAICSASTSAPAAKPVQPMPAEEHQPVMTLGQPVFTMEQPTAEPVAIMQSPAMPEQPIATEPSPVAAVQSAFQEPTKAAPDLDINVLWPKTLDTIVSTGHMTVYLFLLPGKPSISGGTIRILFDEKDELNYNEISADKNISIIRKAVQVVTGSDFTIQTSLPHKEVKDQPTGATAETPDADGAQTPISGIEALKKSADELGIAFYMEE